MTTQTWKVWHLPPEDEHGNQLDSPGVLITTEDGETEITGIVHDPRPASLIAAAPEMLEALDRIRCWAHMARQVRDLAEYGDLIDLLDEVIGKATQAEAR
jgi:hypothetical protein